MSRDDRSEGAEDARDREIAGVVRSVEEHLAAGRLGRADQEFVFARARLGNHPAFEDLARRLARARAEADARRQEQEKTAAGLADVPTRPLRRAGKGEEKTVRLRRPELRKDPQPPARAPEPAEPDTGAEPETPREPPTPRMPESPRISEPPRMPEKPRSVGGEAPPTGAGGPPFAPADRTAATPPPARPARPAPPPLPVSAPEAAPSRPPPSSPRTVGPLRRVPRWAWPVAGVVVLLLGLGLLRVLGPGEPRTAPAPSASDASPEPAEPSEDREAALRTGRAELATAMEAGDETAVRENADALRRLGAAAEDDDLARAESWLAEQEAARRREEERQQAALEARDRLATALDSGDEGEVAAAAAALEAALGEAAAGDEDLARARGWMAERDAARRRSADRERQRRAETAARGELRAALEAEDEAEVEERLAKLEEVLGSGAAEDADLQRASAWLEEREAARQRAAEEERRRAEAERRAEAAEESAPTAPPGTAVDPDTGLMWTKKGNDARISGNDAKTYCENLGLGGFGDWRLPAIEELAALYSTREPGRIRLGIDPTGLRVWSSTEKSPAKNWYFNFGYGTRRASHVVLVANHRVLCVRSPDR